MSKKELVQFIGEYSLMRYVIPNTETIAMQCFQSQVGKLQLGTEKRTLGEYKKLVLNPAVYENAQQKIYDQISRGELESYATFLQGTLWEKLLDRMKYADKKKNAEEFRNFRIDKSQNQKIALSYYQSSLARKITYKYTELLSNNTGDTKLGRRISKWFKTNEYQFNIYWAHVSGFLVDELSVTEAELLIKHRESRTHKKIVDIYSSETLRVYHNYLKILEGLNTVSDS